MPTSRILMGLVLAAFAFAPASKAMGQAPLLNLNPVTLTFDNIIEPLGAFGISSTQSRQIRADHNLARQEVVLALTYLAVNRQRIEHGLDPIYNRVFGGFYDRHNPNFGHGYTVDESHYLRVLHTYGEISRLLNRPTSYSSGNNGNLMPGFALDFFAPKFENLDRGMRQWGMSNSNSTKVYDAYFPAPAVLITDPANKIYPTGAAPGPGLGTGPLVHWDQDTARPTPAGFPTGIAQPNIPVSVFQTFVPPGLAGNPQLITTLQSITTTVGGVTTTSNFLQVSVLEDPLRVYSRTIDNAFYNQKLDIFGNPLNPNQVTLGNIYFANTDAMHAKGFTGPGIERIGDLTAGLISGNLVHPGGNGAQTQLLPWNSGSLIAGINPADFKVPELQRFEMIIASFAEFTTNPADPRGGAFFGLAELVKNTDPGISQFLAGSADATNFGLFVEDLNQAGFTDPRNFPPPGKNGGFVQNPTFQPGVPF